MYFLVFMDAARSWRWTLYSPDGHKIAQSGESYPNAVECEAGIDIVIAINAGTPIRYTP